MRAWGPPGTPGGRGQPSDKAQPWMHPGVPVPTEPYEPEQVTRNPMYAVPGSRIDPVLGYWENDAIILDFLDQAGIALYDVVYRATQTGSSLTGPQAGSFDGGIYSKAIWNSPIFDLQPQLGASNGSSTGETWPVWIPGARLSVQLNFADAFQWQDDILVYSMEWAAFIRAYDPETIQPAQYPQDISTSCWDGWDMPGNPAGSAYSPSVTLCFDPPPGVRFWRQSLIFDRVTSTGPGPKTGDPLITLFASLAGQ